MATELAPIPVEVEAGDTWASIAKEFNTTREELIRLNPHKAHKDALHVGEVLMVPDDSNAG